MPRLFNLWGRRHRLWEPRDQWAREARLEEHGAAGPPPMPSTAHVSFSTNLPPGATNRLRLTISGSASND